ncbi:MAG: transglycosylase domain-containing protein [Hyphomicrobiaceae bacterium]
MLAVFAGLAGTIVLSLAFIYYTVRFPDPSALRQRDKAPVVRVLAADGSLLAERGEAYDFVPFDLLPRHVINAVVATEDRRFFTHWGLDPIGIARAGFANLKAGRYAQGGSTLTQQLAKNLFLTSERSLRRKVEELMLALWLEVRLSKQDIAELYLNRVYFGGGAYGIEAASHRYFGKSARSLTVAESAVLAGLLKAPSRYSPANSPVLARARSQVVLKRMLDAGYITAADETAMLRRPVRFAMHANEREAGAQYAVEFVLDRLPPVIGPNTGELVVETTIDTRLQRTAQAVVEQILATEGRAAGAQQAAVVVIDTEGRIRALVGGRSFADSQFNRAVRARRQPGSAFKPFVYLAALERGWTPDTLVQDAPITVAGWTPRNDSGTYQGVITLRTALAQSVNSVAVRLQQEVGTSRVISLAQRLGIASELRPSPSIALGTSEVSVLELTGAYGVLASGGLSVTPHAVRKVRTGSGAVVYARPATQPRMLVSPDHAGEISDMLHTVIVSGTGRRALLPRHPSAGKTGTTQEFRDAWFVGYTAQLAAGVWVGNDDGKPMNKVVGGGLPARIWREVMLAAHERLPPGGLLGHAAANGADQRSNRAMLVRAAQP